MYYSLVVDIMNTALITAGIHTTDFIHIKILGTIVYILKMLDVVDSRFCIIFLRLDGSTSGSDQLIIISSARVLAVVLIGVEIAVLAVVIFCIRGLQRRGQSHNAQSDESNLELQSNKGVY